jgi:predicted unusual protein kinase regulating ubiquinone biosynthesis (AarF/ABC1/UbiB family)
MHALAHVSRPATKSRRFFKLAGMTASVATNFAKTRVKTLFLSEERAVAARAEANARSGSRIAETLGELKGAVMKVGQMASIASDVLPKEIADALGRLQREAPPMPYAVIAEQIEAELGSPPDTLFARFEREPFAAASIGQVHRACTDDGREVVVKVQYPGVDTAVDSDLRQLKVALRASGLVNVGKEALDAAFGELRARLHEELDYCNEADNVRAFAAFHARHPWLVVPGVVGERSSQRVLTMTYEPGDPLRDLDALDYPQELRDELGAHLFHMMCSQVFRFGRIHGDPNPGNLAFRRDGSLVLYDFGCVKRLQGAIVTAYRDAIVRGIDEDYDGVEDALRRLGVRRVSGPPIEPAYYKRWRDIFAEPFLAVTVFDYGHSTIHDDVVKMIPGVLKRMASFQAPKELLFLDRMVAGHYGNMCKLRARVPSLTILRSYMDGWTAFEDPAPSAVGSSTTPC